MLREELEDQDDVSKNATRQEEARLDKARYNTNVIAPINVDFKSTSMTVILANGKSDRAVFAC